MKEKNNPPYMFKNKFVDYFFSWSWWSSTALWSPVALALFIFATMKDSHFLIHLLFFILGIFLWTFCEYFLHRFFLHYFQTSKRFQKIHYVLHGMHHAWPNNKKRIIIPPFLSFAIVLSGTMFLLALLPIHFALSTSSGFIVGIIWYEFMHFATHHIKWKFNWFKRLKRHHLLHHHHRDFKEKNFGVTNRFWDKFFGTN